jgi:osmoprotectant transport system ATP-binding protein
MATVVEFSDVVYSIDGRRLVGPLSFTAEEGKTLVLVGASGSGKTTTLRLVNRLVEPTSGIVLVDGKDAKDWDAIALRRRIGYVIQEVGLFPHLSVARNIGVVPRLMGDNNAAVGARVHELLELVGLPPADFSNRRPHELSGGQRQRVGVARALAADPPILLCDEPFGAVDPFTRSELQKEFKRLAEGLQKTILFVTHDVNEAVRLGDRIAVFEQGEIRFLGSMDEFATSTNPVVVALRESNR